MTASTQPFEVLGRAGAGPRLAAAVLVAALAGCAGSAPPPAATVASAVEAGSGCRLTREERVVLGGFKLAAVKMLLRWAGEGEDLREAQEILSHLRRIEVASYRAHRGAACDAAACTEVLGRALTARSWRPMMEERGRESSSRVFTHAGARGELDGLYVVDMAGGELEIVLLQGDVERLLATAMAADVAAAARAVADGG